MTEVFKRKHKTNEKLPRQREFRADVAFSFDEGK